MRPFLHVSTRPTAPTAVTPNEGLPAAPQPCEPTERRSTTGHRVGNLFGKFADRRTVRRKSSAKRQVRRFTPADTAIPVPTGTGHLRAEIELVRVDPKLYFVLTLIDLKRNSRNEAPRMRQWVLYDTYCLGSRGLAHRVFALACAALDRELTVGARF